MESHSPKGTLESPQNTCSASVTLLVLCHNENTELASVSAVLGVRWRRCQEKQ